MSEAERLVSVILPVRDREAAVARAIRSVLAQTYRPIELIVVDDGSVDGTRGVIEAFGDAVKLLVQPARGVYAARNLALRHARGALVAFIDSDDAWYPHKLALQVPLFDRVAVGLVFSDVAHVTADGAPAGRTSFAVAPPRRGRAAEGFVCSNFVPTVSVVARRTCLEEIGGFSEAQPLSADMLAWFRIALRHELDFVAQPLADYTVHAAGISHDLGSALAARIALFRDELARTSDAATHRLIRRILFSLSLSLLFAAARRRARTTPRAIRFALHTMREVGGIAAPRWAVGYFVHQVRTRARHALA